MHPVLKKLADCGQSIWYDNISRGLLTSGRMQALIDLGVVGVTSNPSIFQKAICESGDYDEALRALARRGGTTAEIYDALTLEDIGRTADLFRPVYDRTAGGDGYISIEVSPDLAYDATGTLSEARRLFQTLGRPNVMIKIPATEEGLPAVRRAIAEGINVNVTLIFSAEVYGRVMDAYLSGLEDRLAAGGNAARVASVASFFVSRVDTAVDARVQKLIEAGRPGLGELLGRAAVANSKVAYARYQEVFSGPRFAALKAKGGRVQRPLWASTSTKNPAYSPTIYVDTLIGPDTVNTVPPPTLDALCAGMAVANTVIADLDGARRVLDRIREVGIDIDEVTEELRTAGVKAFADSFRKLLADVEARRAGFTTAARG